MKSCHVALVVSALAMTASGASIDPLPPSPTKLARDSRAYTSGPEIQPITRRRAARGPLPRSHKRSKVSKNSSGEEKGNLENQLPNFEEYINSFPHESNRNLRSAESQLHGAHAKLVKPNSASKATASDPETLSDIPGFVDIALPDQDAGVARTVFGLAYSMNSDSATGELELGTSSSHSTQFFMSPMKNRQESSLYRLRVPVMDSTTFQSVDHCATFPLSPGPLSLRKCGSLPGFSQTFSYDAASGEIQPVYRDGSRSNLVASDQNAPSRQINKRQFYRASDCEPAPAPLSKRDGTTSTSPPSAIFYFVPAASAKPRNRPSPKHSE